MDNYIKRVISKNRVKLIINIMTNMITIKIKY